LVGKVFIVWDIYDTHLGVWGFNPDYLIGINIGNLPIEEVLFVICIPYACLYTYHCFKIVVKPFDVIPTKSISIILLISLLILALYNITNLYTGVTFLSLFVVLSYSVFILKPVWFHRFYLTLLVLIVTHIFN
jgi:hypothetical protein